jgi:predicted nucleic acid-binding protein
VNLLVDAYNSAAHIAALAIENQVFVHSNDSDFSRFPGLRWIHPLHAAG